MKVIVCEGIKRVHTAGDERNKREGETLVNVMADVRLKSDTTLLKDGKPFFVPTFLGEVRGQAYVVCRVGKLGKSIEERFGQRYIDGITVGVDFKASEWAQWLVKGNMSADVAYNTDGSSVVGQFVGIMDDEGSGADGLEVGLRLEREGGREVREYSRAMDVLTQVRLEVAYVSRYMSLRQGDLLFALKVGDEFEARIDSRMVATIGGREVLCFRVK